MRIKAAILGFLLALTVAGCGLHPDPMLGIEVDQNLQVVSVEPYSPALKAGIQPGDILIDLTWFSFSNNIRHDDHDIDKSTIPFTDVEGISALMDFEYLLKLRLTRAGQIVKVVIQPSVPIWRKYPDPTPTPIPSSDRLF